MTTQITDEIGRGENNYFVDPAQAESGNHYVTFSVALDWLKMSIKVTREAWDDPTQFVFLVLGHHFVATRPPLLSAFPEGALISYTSHIDKVNNDGSVSPWVPTQQDLLAGDWKRVL